MKLTDKIPKNSLGKTRDYSGLLTQIKARIRSAQYEALKAVNKKLVGLYWDIGRIIVERQDVEGWGKSVVQQLAADLRAEFPGVGGFSASSLWRMKAFFEAYTGLEKLALLVREIGWGKNMLNHQIDNQSYEKSLLGQTNFDQALTPELRALPKALKDQLPLPKDITHFLEDL